MNNTDNIIESEIQELEKNIREDDEAKRLSKKQNRQKKTKRIIFLVTIIFIIILGIFISFIFLKSTKEKVEENYDVVMQEYGDLLSDKLKEYKEINEENPTIESLIEENKLEKHIIKCEINRLYDNGAIYLDKCSINNSTKLYTYGEEYHDERSLEEIMEEYGNIKLSAVSNYFEKNGKLPTTKLNINYYEHQIECKSELYYDENNIYLGGCTIDNSKETYFFGALIEDGKIQFYKNGQEYTIQCQTSSCMLYDEVFPYAIVEDGDKGYNIFNYEKNEHLYNAINADKVSFVIYKTSYTNQIVGILMKNKKEEEAFYNLEQNRTIFNYGKYTYDWTCDSDNKKSCSAGSNTLKIYSNGKAGLADYENGNIILTPSRYTNLNHQDNVIYTELNGKMGAITYNQDFKKLENVILEPEDYEKVILYPYPLGLSGEEYHLVVYKDKKAGLLTYSLSDKKIKNIMSPDTYDDIEASQGYIYVYQNGKAGLLKYDQDGTVNNLIIKPVEYSKLKVNEEYVYGMKNKSIYLLDIKTGDVLLSGKSYQAIASVDYDGGRAMVYDGIRIEIVDIAGKKIKKLQDINQSQYSLYYGNDGFPLTNGYHNDSNEHYTYITFNEESNCIDFIYEHRKNEFEKSSSECKVES